MSAPRYADVLIPVAVDRPYSYRIPADLAVGPGDLVAVPLGILGSRAMTDARAKGFGALDPGQIDLDFPQGWVDPRWVDELQRTFVDFGSVPLDDGASLRRLAASIEALPFVAEVADPRISWSAGASFDIRMRRPVACIRVGDRFLAVDEEGVVLAGGCTVAVVTGSTLAGLASATAAVPPAGTLSV